MKKEDFVKLGLDEDAAKKCADASAEELKGFIPKARFDEVNGEKKNLETAKTTLEGQLETLKNSTGDVDAMKQQIATLQAENKQKDDDHTAEMTALKISNALDTAIGGLKGKNSKAIKALLDMDKVTLDDKGEVTGHMDQLNALVKAEDSKFLFDTASAPKVKGAKTGETGKENPDGKVDTSKMTYSELAAYMAANPDTKID